MELNMISNIFKSRSLLYNLMKDNKEGLLLDPFSTVVRISLLNFKSDNTKISICDNTIYYQEPSLIQGILRWQNGDKRSDLHNLLNPMLLCKIWFKENEEVNQIFKFAISGLKRLKESYKDNGEEICHALSHYITILLVNNDELNKFSDTLNNDNVIYEKIKDLWSKEEVHIIYLLLTKLYEMKIDNNNNNEIIMNSYIQAIDKILNGKDLIIRGIINYTVKGRI